MGLLLVHIHIYPLPFSFFFFASRVSALCCRGAGTCTRVACVFFIFSDGEEDDAKKSNAGKKRNNCG